MEFKLTEMLNENGRKAIVTASLEELAELFDKAFDKTSAPSSVRLLGLMLLVEITDAYADNSSKINN